MGKGRRRQRFDVDAQHCQRRFECDCHCGSYDGGVDHHDHPPKVGGLKTLHPSAHPTNHVGVRFPGRWCEVEVRRKQTNRFGILIGELDQRPPSPIAKRTCGDGIKRLRVSTEHDSRGMSAMITPTPTGIGGVAHLRAPEPVGRFEVASTGEDQIPLVDLGKTGDQDQTAGHDGTSIVGTLPDRSRSHAQLTPPQPTHHE